MAPNGQSRTVSIVGNPYYFTGRRLDGQTDLYYYRTGYWSPEIGRFLQTDPIGYQGGLGPIVASPRGPEQPPGPERSLE